MPSAAEIESRMKSFRETCKRRGIRVTPQRTEVFRHVARTEEHPDADAIFKRVQRRIPNVSLDTVYRALYKLEDEGLISRVQVSGDRLRFDGNGEKHHHFVCSRCGTIRDFTSEEVDRLSIPASVKSWGSIQGRHLQIRGICRKCLKKRGKSRKRV